MCSGLKGLNFEKASQPLYIGIHLVQLTLIIIEILFQSVVKLFKCQWFEYSATNFVVCAIILCESFIKADFHLTFVTGNFEKISRNKLSRKFLSQKLLRIK